MCTLPKPPAGRALYEGKEAPQAAFPSWCFPAQTKRRTEGIRVPVPLKKQQVNPDMEKLTGSKLGKEYNKAIYCHSAYLIICKASCKMWAG